MRNRYPDWPERLAQYIDARRHAPFAWGVNDCAMFAADAVVALTGVDPVPSVRGTYDDARGAADLIDAAGGLRELVPLPAKTVGHAQRGDIVLSDIDGRATLGVCVGADYAAPGDVGLVFRPMAEAVAAYEV